MSKTQEEISALKHHLDHARWLMDTDIRLSENHLQRAAVLLGFVSVEIAAIASFLKGFFIPNVQSFEPMSPILKVVIGLLILVFLSIYVLLSIALIGPEVTMPFPLDPMQLEMIENRKSELDTLKRITVDTLECIYPKVIHKKTVGKRKLDKDQERQLALYAKHGKSLWMKNSERHRIFNCVFVLLLIAQGQLLTTILAIRFGW